jgi:hypothetical protein
VPPGAIAAAGATMQGTSDQACSAAIARSPGALSVVFGMSEPDAQRRRRAETEKMLRGSRQGERRGGRERGTPNRRTILSETILAIGVGHPTASRRAFLRKLANDRKLPGDIRIAIAPRCYPAKQLRSFRRSRPGGGRSTVGQEAAASGGLRGHFRAREASQRFRPSQTGTLKRSKSWLALSRMPRQIPKREQKRH